MAVRDLCGVQKWPFNMETVLFGPVSLSTRPNDVIIGDCNGEDPAMDKYTNLSRLELCEIRRHLIRSEQDLEERLAAREERTCEREDDKPDPIRKRLFFLLLKQKRQRRAVDGALASCEYTDSKQRP